MDGREFAAVLTAHYEAHTALDPQDVYKLIYQRVFGPEHLIENTRAAKEQLYLEVLRLRASPPAVSLCEPLSPQLCRVNLQPFVQSGGVVAILWRAFRQTAQSYQPGTLVDLERDWRHFVTSPWAQRYPSETLEQFWLQMATVGFPPVHHSQAYAEANAPHYRVVLSSLLADQPGFAP